MMVIQIEWLSNKLDALKFQEIIEYQIYFPHEEQQNLNYFL